MKTVKINRRSKLGFGYTASVENDENGHLRVCKTTRPDYTGTYNKVCEAIENDRTLASFRSGGTYYSTQWFLKLDGKWYEIDDRKYESKWYFEDLSRDSEIEIDIID